MTPGRILQIHSVRLPEGNQLKNHKVVQSNLPSQPRLRNQQRKVPLPKRLRRIGAASRINWVLHLHHRHLRCQPERKRRETLNRHRSRHKPSVHRWMTVLELVCSTTVAQRLNVQQDHPGDRTSGQDAHHVLPGRTMTRGRQQLRNTIAAKKPADKPAIKPMVKLVIKLRITVVIKQPTNRVSQDVGVEGDVEAVAVAGGMIAAPKKTFALTTMKSCLATDGISMASAANGMVRLLRHLRMFSQKLTLKMDSGKG